MSTTFVTALLSVRANMTYTELGKGKQRKEHIENGTNRIVAQFGDKPSREAFVAYCENSMSRHPNAVNEGFELRVSWATDELDPNNPDDIQRGMEHAYLLCHELAPDSPCWVTMHTDGDGGCVHAHATIVNHDVRTGLAINKGDTSLYAPRVQAVNDELSRANGLQVLGQDKAHETWAQRSATLDAKSFDRHLGDKIAFARDNADSMEAFKKNLEYAGVTLTETTKTDKKTGEVTTGWSYKAKDVWGPKMRTRKRRASKLCDEFTKDGIEAYFEEKERQAAVSEARKESQAKVQEKAQTEALETAAEPLQPEIPSAQSEPKPTQPEPKPVQSEKVPGKSETRPEYTPHELPESLKRIVEGFGNGRDDDKSLGDW